MRRNLGPLAVVSILLLLLGGSAVEAFIALLAPTTLVAVAVSSNQIDLSWADGNTIESGFVIQRSSNPFTNFKKIGTTPADVTTFRDLRVSASRTYYYRVRAV